jgi:bis(5'-nucleosyl)-tetraphosphatase (symmetrical)
MATYVIGDLQGCYEPLQRLLKKIAFDPKQDHLWFAGDLVNRGPESLECLRFIRHLAHRATVVLGNHDLHLLATYYGAAKNRKNDTLEEVLNAPDCVGLMDWLRHQPLVHYDAANNWCMTHAGLPPMWSARKARALAQEVESVLRGDCASFFAQMYGNQPDLWDNGLTGQDRLRVIVNYLTRMRFVDAAGRLDLVTKEGEGSRPNGFVPWFEHPQRKSENTRIVFGHWAALEGKADVANVWALDTGCVWGGKLTALRLEDQRRFSVPAKK